MGEFDGKVALVTGGASGIGLATAERLCADGASVVIADIDRAGGEAAADKLGARFAALDVADPSAWNDVVGRIRAEQGGLDIAFLNAGVTTRRPRTDEAAAWEEFDIASLSHDSYRRILGINVDGVVFGARAVTPAMEARGGGAIVATASVAGLIGFAPDPIYTLTKHAVVGLVRALGPTLASRQITINGICPGVVDTNIGGPKMGERAREAGIAVMAPSQIADAVANAIRSGETGVCWVCLANREHNRHEFSPIDGIGV